MSDIKLVWSLMSYTPGDWPPDPGIEPYWDTGDYDGSYVSIFRWERCDDTYRIIDHRITDLLDQIASRHGVEDVNEVKPHIKNIQIVLFILRETRLQVLETKFDPTKVPMTREVLSIPIRAFSDKYAYIGGSSGYMDGDQWHEMIYTVGNCEVDVLQKLLEMRPPMSKRTPNLRIIKIPINHKGGPTYSFHQTETWSEYNENGFMDGVYEKDKEFYFDVEKTFPRDPQGYYDKCMELIAGEHRNYDYAGNFINAVWEYWCIDRKGYENFMNPETFQEMMEMKWPIFWYIDEFTDWDNDEEDME